MEFLDTLLWNNTIRAWLIFIGITAGSYIFVSLLKLWITRILISITDKTLSDFDDFIVALLQGTNAFFIFIFCGYFSSFTLDLTYFVRSTLKVIAIIMVILLVAFWISAIIEYLIKRRVKAKVDVDPFAATNLGVMGLIIKIALWAVTAILVLHQIPGLKIDALVASLGIAGIAVALAVQGILSDLFAAISIALDKPFAIGDSIVVDEFTGKVEHIGLKSTRVRALSGEELIFSNSDLLSSRIRNFRGLERRRIKFTIGLTYDTTPEQLKKIPVLVKSFFDEIEGATFFRAHFREMGDFSLNFDILYFVESSEFSDFLDAQQEINLKIYQRFTEEGIEFAFPTQSIILEK